MSRLRHYSGPHPVSSLADAGSIIRAHKSCNRFSLGPSLTTLAHAHPFADFNLHNRHSHQLLRRSVGATLTEDWRTGDHRIASQAPEIAFKISTAVESKHVSGAGLPQKAAWREIRVERPKMAFVNKRSHFLVDGRPKAVKTDIVVRRRFFGNRTNVQAAHQVQAAVFRRS